MAGNILAQDEMSKWLSIIGLIIPVFVWLLSKDFIWLFPALLCIFGLAIQHWLSKPPVADANDDPKLTQNVLFYALITLASLILIQTIQPNLLKMSFLSLTGFDAILFGVMIAIGEEQLFRGGLFLKIGQTTKSFIVTAFITATMFMLYHLGVYQDNFDAMFFVLSAGLLLAFVNVITGTISTSIFAHIGANIIAYSPLGLGGIVTLISDPYIILLTSAIFALLIMLLIRNKHKVNW